MPAAYMPLIILGVLVTIDKIKDLQPPSTENINSWIYKILYFDLKLRLKGAL